MQKGSGKCLAAVSAAASYLAENHMDPDLNDPSGWWDSGGDDGLSMLLRSAGLD